jgi:hypothetical protein
MKADTFDHYALILRHNPQIWRDRLYKKLDQEGEVRLTNLERMVLLELLEQQTKKRGRGRPKKSDNAYRDFALHFYIADLEFRGESTEAAVAAAEKKFGVKRSTIYKIKAPRPKSR